MEAKDEVSHSTMKVSHRSRLRSIQAAPAAEAPAAETAAEEAPKADEAAAPAAEEPKAVSYQCSNVHS